MTTDKPRIQAYLEPELHQKLKDFQQERELKESPALNQILREYFGIENFKPIAQAIDSEQIRLWAKAECQIWANQIFSIINSKLEIFGIRLDTLESIVKPIEGLAELPEAKALSELPSAVPKSLNGSELARRLGIAKSVISTRKARADFEDWSKAKDPEAIAWRYDARSLQFFPVEEGD